jgi:hypothetical protein
MDRQKKYSERKKKMVEWLIGYRFTPTHTAAAGHIILTPVNQLIVMGLKIWSLSNLGFVPETFRSLAQRADQLR